MARTAASVLVWLAFLAGIAWIGHTEILSATTTRASDALPLYLSACAVADGLDPTLQESLSQAYHHRQMNVGAATFSTLYPATAGWLLKPVSTLSWESFTDLWRWILLCSLASFPFAVLATEARPSRYLRAGLLGAVLAWHPYAAECIRLGQVNLLLAALCTVAMVAVLAGPAWVGGIALATGALIKLVPAGLALPLLVGRQLKPVLVAGLVGSIGLGLTLLYVPAPRLIQGIQETLAFQASIDPDWLVGKNPAPMLVRWFGYFRHEPMQGLTLLSCGLIVGLRPCRQSIVAGMGLICAWLGADAAGFHVLYTPLLYPVFLLASSEGWLVWVACLGGYSLLPWLFLAAPEPQAVLFGVGVWGWCLYRLLSSAKAVASGALEQSRELAQAGAAISGLIVGALLGKTWPEAGPVAAPLPEGQTIPDGAGFIRPNDEVPGAIKALGGGLDRPASTLAKPGTIRDLQLYLRKAPLLWEQAAARYPARSSILKGRAQAAPSGELREISGRDIRTWLLEEKTVMAQAQSEGLELGELPLLLQKALASGLAEEAPVIPAIQ
jgi:hypothetical protein